MCSYHPRFRSRMAAPLHTRSIHAGEIGMWKSSYQLKLVREAPCDWKNPRLIGHGRPRD